MHNLTEQQLDDLEKRFDEEWNKYHIVDTTDMI